MSSMEPLVALVRIVYLLDRAHASGHRVSAFQRAMGTVAGMDRAELERLDRAGQLGSLPGIGDTTAAVISDALAGRVPRYLSELEETSKVDAGVGEALRTQLRGDLHSHTTWSDGGWPVEAMARAARAIGHEYLAITDHSPRLTVAHGLSPERLLEQLDEVSRINDRLDGVRLLTGMEVDILVDGSLDLSDELLSRLDVVVASVHSKFTLPAPEMTRRLVKAVRSQHVDILGHCTNRILEGKGRPPSQFDAGAVFEACAEHRTAVEINSRPERLDPPEDLLSRAVEAGCLFAIDSDAHAPGQLEWQGFGCRKAAEAGISPDRILTTWPVEQLVSWTSAA